MANLTIDAVEVVHAGDQITAPCGEDMVGFYARLDATTGKWLNGNGTSSTEVGAGVNYILAKEGKAGEAVTGYGNGSILAFYTSTDVNSLASLNIGADIFVSDTDSTLADTAGTVSTVIAQVIPGHGHPTTLDKLARIDIPG